MLFPFYINHDEVVHIYLVKWDFFRNCYDTLEFKDIEESSQCRYGYNVQKLQIMNEDEIRFMGDTLIKFLLRVNNGLEYEEQKALIFFPMKVQ
jgi:hypothetical protein